MSQNTSAAVMAQRVEAHDSLDDFPTPPWATRALLEHVLCVEPHEKIWEPACNRGHMVRPLKEYCKNVYASDVHDYGSGFPVDDFLFPNSDRTCDWVITNPPFRLADQFIRTARQVANRGVAIFIRTQFVEGKARWKELFKPDPPTLIAQFTERVVLHKGKLSADGSSATAYCWIVWAQGKNPTEFRWIPPCRRTLERPEDYP